MNRQLISIETVPIKVEYVEKKPIRVSSNPRINLQVEKNPDTNSVSIKSSDAVSIRMDSFDYSKYIPSGSSTYTATAQYSSGGSLDLNIQMQNGDGVSIEHAMNGIARMADAIPTADAPSFSDFSNAASVADNFGDLHLSFDFSGLISNSPLEDDYSATFMPPDLEFKVVERPKVIIKYVGGPIYIPRSADPNYVPMEEQFNLISGQGIDLKV